MSSVDLNNQLYQSLCDSVRKWFEKDRGYETTFSVTHSDGYRTYVYPKVVIGDVERDAELEVGVILWESDMQPYCWICCNLTFNDEIKVTEEDIELEVLRLINSYNLENPARCIFYDKNKDKIIIHQEWNIDRGTEITDKEIGQMLDSFMLNSEIEDLCGVIEAGGWRFPELYIDNSPVMSIRNEKADCHL